MSRKFCLKCTKKCTVLIDRLSLGSMQCIVDLKYSAYLLEKGFSWFGDTRTVFIEIEVLTSTCSFAKYIVHGQIYTAFYIGPLPIGDIDY
jgi:hypothetical protein